MSKQHPHNWHWRLIESERPRQIGVKLLHNKTIVEGTFYARTSDKAKERAVDAYTRQYEGTHDVCLTWLMPWIVKDDAFMLIEHRHLFNRTGIRMKLVLTKIK